MLVNQGVGRTVMHWRKGDSSALSHHANTPRKLTVAPHTRLDTVTYKATRGKHALAHLSASSPEWRGEVSCISQDSQRNRTSRMCMCGRRDSFEGTGSHDYGGYKSEICSGPASWRASNNVAVQARGCLLTDLLLPSGLSSCSIKAFNWLDEAHLHYGR